MDDRMTLKKIHPTDILKYELHASWWAPFIHWGWGRDLTARYFVWKTKRKLRRYAAWGIFLDAQQNGGKEK